LCSFATTAPERACTAKLFAVNCRFVLSPLRLGPSPSVLAVADIFRSMAAATFVTFNLEFKSAYSRQYYGFEETELR
jgi:hypothetical protein